MRILSVYLFACRGCTVPPGWPLQSGLPVLHLPLVQGNTDQSTARTSLCGLCLLHVQPRTSDQGAPQAGHQPSLFSSTPHVPDGSWGTSSEMAKHPSWSYCPIGNLGKDLSLDLLLRGHRVASLVLDRESRCRRGLRESDRDRLECRLRSADLDRVLDLFARWSRRSSI